ncbi:hypothetical protein EMCG_00487 [[Emmonsia] crescens]|uniref:Uncharacterized protein n=1 Tax=[Emmonsia] crescens TaxID=73230 RepID=A0A0G2HVZ5_9EURO|nr:hypothetical protein EMCG_00487 [Emmonsia crescens UAMH 3008]
MANHADISVRILPRFLRQGANHVALIASSEVPTGPECGARRRRQTKSGNTKPNWAGLNRKRRKANPRGSGAEAAGPTRQLEVSGYYLDPQMNGIADLTFSPSHHPNESTDPYKELSTTTILP